MADNKHDAHRDKLLADWAAAQQVVAENPRIVERSVREEFRAFQRAATGGLEALRQETEARQEQQPPSSDWWPGKQGQEPAWGGQAYQDMLQTLERARASDPAWARAFAQRRRAQEEHARKEDLDRGY